ncbi:MAG: aminopeptidase N [Oligoflexales bacterium]
MFPRMFLILLCGLASIESGFAKGFERGLSKQDADSRSSLISETSYNLTLNVDPTKDDFEGTVETNFSLKSKLSGLRIDFSGGTVVGVLVNGAKAKFSYNGEFIKLEGKDFKPGRNSIVTKYSHPFSRDGSGLYKFVDPEDGKAYVYTDFEPYDANRLFPHFDQPDIKAAYKLTATVPSTWQVVTSVMEASKVDAGGGKTTWNFPESKRFSSYVFSFHGGPYHTWVDAKSRIPSRLMVRESLAKYVQPEDWFLPTRQGFDFYEAYFDYKYPFEKYDQIIVPDFNAGAMENVAAVTFSENRVNRGEETASERDSRASVILHEMAHMWFGDLVTMKWWNDLWLNESFATYMATKAQYEGSKLETAWLKFYLWSKQSAYYDDQLVTTHPIVANVPHTEQAFANFDGITYGKGASVLKQTDFLLGQEKFRAGVRSYFDRFAFKNTKLDNFVGALEKASGTGLSGWQKDWLETESLNTVTADYSCQDNKVKDFALTQSAPKEYPRLRTHRTKVGLVYATESGKFVVKETADVTYEGKRTVVASLVGKACPVMVYPNYEDYDYVKVSLDRATLAAAKQNLKNVEDTLLRAMLWQSLADMVRDAEIGIAEYAELVYTNLPAEKVVEIATSVADVMHGRNSTSYSILSFFPKESGAEKEIYQKQAAKMERFFWQMLGNAPSGSDFQKEWAYSAIRSTSTADGITKLRALLDAKESYSGLTIDQDMRWSIIGRLSELGDKDAHTLLQGEAKRDPSSRGKQAALSAEVRAPDVNAKKQWFQSLIAPNSSYTLAELKQIMRGFFPISQDQVKAQFADQFYTALPKLIKERDTSFLGAFVSNLNPTDCSTSSSKALEKFIANNKATLVPVVFKNLREAVQENDRCVKIQAKARTSSAM